LERIYLRLLDGRGREEDVKLLESVANQMKGETLCALGEFATSPVLSTIKHFPDEYYAKVSGGPSGNGRSAVKSDRVRA
jgi:NADH-quinone oxidoreductase subunit F